MTRANPSCPNFGMTNELRGVEKKTERDFQLSPFQYPDPGSNRDGSESTGV